MVVDKVIINITRQKLSAFYRDNLIKAYPISTAAKGIGNEKGSYRTPLGKHLVRAKIGKGLPSGAIFVARRWTGETYDDSLAEKFPRRDWILSRILWLCGCEPGVNRFGSVDTMARYIYIHGTPDTYLLGSPVSHGCIRLSNADVIELFDMLELSTSVNIIKD